MTNKEYLAQAYRLDKRIDSKLEQIVSLRELATRATSVLSENPIKGTGKIYVMEDVIIKIIDLEKEICRDIDELVELKKMIMSSIKNINNPEQQTLLELRYLCFKTWEEIAVEMGYSIQHLFRIHDKVMKNILTPKIGE